MKTNLKKIAYWASICVFGAVLGVSLQFVKAWTEPASAPPSSNIGAPINTGSIPQNKIGSIGSSGSISAVGAVQGSQLCIGADCRNAWPAGGVVSGGMYGYCVNSNGNRNPRLCGNGDGLAGRGTAGISGAPIPPAICDAANWCDCQTGYKSKYMGGQDWGAAGSTSKEVYMFTCVKE